MEINIYPLNQIFEPMKPAKINNRNEAQVVKLAKCLESPEYVVEEKIDGCKYNIIGTRFFSAHISEKTGYPVEKTDNYPHLTEILEKANLGNILIDGEVHYIGLKSQDVTPVTGSSPEKAIKYQETNGFVYYAMYDILRDSNGNDLTQTPWRLRREILESIGQKLNTLSNNFYVNPVVFNNKANYVKELLEMGREGGVLKHINGLYYPGKRPAWNQIKVKQEDTDDAIIMGFEDPEKFYTGDKLTTHKYWEDGEPITKFYAQKLIGAVTLGKHNDQGELVRVGTVSGMTDKIREDMTKYPDKYLGKVAQIKFMEKTNDGNYRHASFKQIHPDSNNKEVIL